jgi:hypothetical protein
MQDLKSYIDSLELTDKDYKDLMIPFHKVGDNVELAKYFKILDNREEFKLQLGKLHKNSVIRYIILMYDMNSPLIKKINDFGQRILVSAYLAGFSQDENGTFDDEVKKMMAGGNNRVNKMIISYLKAHRSTKWSLICANWIVFYEEIEKVIRREEPSRKININTLQKELEMQMIEFANQDSNLHLQQELFEQIEQENLFRLRPEGIAEYIEDGIEPIKANEIR